MRAAVSCESGACDEAANRDQSSTGNSPTEAPRAVSGSVAVLQWSGILAIWVVNAGVWVTLVAVALGG